MEWKSYMKIKHRQFKHFLIYVKVIEAIITISLYLRNLITLTQRLWNRYPILDKSIYFFYFFFIYIFLFFYIIVFWFFRFFKYNFFYYDFFGFVIVFFFFDFFFFISRRLLKVTKFTTNHQIWPKMDKNSITIPFFGPKTSAGARLQELGQSRPHELEVGSRGGQYLLVLI